jgi:hypothetical protein
MGEERQNHERKHSPEDRDQQPEMGPAQLEQSVPPHARGWRSPSSFVGQTVCSHIAPRTPAGCDTAAMLMFPEVSTPVKRRSSPKEIPVGARDARAVGTTRERCLSLGRQKHVQHGQAAMPHPFNDMPIRRVGSDGGPPTASSPGQAPSDAGPMRHRRVGDRVPRQTSILEGCRESP